MSRLLSDARAALDLAMTRYFDSCKALCSPLETVPKESDLLYANEDFESNQRFIDFIKQKLSDTAMALKRAQNIHTPIHRIPPEILIKIMLLDLEPREFTVWENPMKRRALRAISLSAVCSHWRELAIQTASFWSHIPLPFSEQLVEIFINRAKEIPLKISVVETTSKDAPDSDHHHSPWKGQSVVVDHVHTVGTLNMSIYSLRRVGCLNDWVSNFNIPCCLQELSLAYTGECWSVQGREPAVATTAELDTFADQLSILSLSGIDCNWNKCTFSKLRVLQLSGIFNIKPEGFEHIIASSPMLQVLELQYISFSDSQTKIKPITSPSLKTLRMFYLCPFTFGRVLGMIEPKAYNVEIDISSMSFWDEEYDSLELTDGVSTLVSVIRGNSNITSLGITGSPDLLKGGLLSAITGHLPGLATLCLSDIRLKDDDLPAIVNAIQTSPQIKTIRMRKVKLWLKDEENFKRMLKDCPVECIKLIDCVLKNTTAGTGPYRLERGGLLHKWALQAAPNVVF